MNVVYLMAFVYQNRVSNAILASHPRVMKGISRLRHLALPVSPLLSKRKRQCNTMIHQNVVGTVILPLPPPLSILVF